MEKLKNNVTCYVTFLIIQHPAASPVKENVFPAMLRRFTRSAAEPPA
jgi:hypothetical protein